MTKVKNILRCYAMGMGIKGISSTFHLSRNTVRKYVRRFLESGMTLDKIMSMSEERVQEMFSDTPVRDRKMSPMREELEPLLPEYAKRMSRKGAMIKDLYEEYAQGHPNGYKRSHFGTLLRRYMCQTKAIGHVEHPAGDQMYIDFAGDRLQVVDIQTGEVSDVEVFVAILPCSQYTYCEAVWSQKKEDLILACENALHFFGGAPMAIVPDNLKSAVIKSDKNEPIINEEFAAFAEFYNCAVYPARVRHPKDKALVENAVKLMYRSVYVDLEDRAFNDLETLNAAIRVSLEAFNNRKLTGRKQSRRQLFEEMESECLQQLPAIRHQMKERKSMTVMRNSYITLHKHHYSMPVEYIGKRVDIIYDADTLEIYHGLKLVTTHHRDDTPYTYTQKPSHNLPGRHGSYEQDLDEIFQRARAIDNIVLTYLQDVAAENKYPPQAFRVCRGILSLEKKFGLDRLVAACACATQARRYGYQDIKDILEKGNDADFMQPSDTPEDERPATSMTHKNIRGRDYFSIKSTNSTKKNENGNK